MTNYPNYCVAQSLCLQSSTILSRFRVRIFAIVSDRILFQRIALSLAAFDWCRKSPD
jgi:hypothetical protein